LGLNIRRFCEEKTDFISFCCIIILIKGIYDLVESSELTLAICDVLDDWLHKIKEIVALLVKSYA